MYLGEDSALDWPDSYCKVASNIDSAITTLFSFSASEAIAFSYFSWIYIMMLGTDIIVNKTKKASEMQIMFQSKWLTFLFKTTRIDITFQKQEIFTLDFPKLYSLFLPTERRGQIRTSYWKPVNTVNEILGNYFNVSVISHVVWKKDTYLGMGESKFKGSLIWWCWWTRTWVTRQNVRISLKLLFQQPFCYCHLKLDQKVHARIHRKTNSILGISKNVKSCKAPTFSTHYPVKRISLPLRI